MATRADILYLSATDQDQTWGTDVRKLAETAQALNSTTICSHPNSAGTTSITLDPLTTSTTQSDIRDALGWAVNEQGADGMESTSTRKRRIRAGDWVFTMRLGLPTAGTATGTLTGSFSARVYRVGPSPTFTRTLLFTTGDSTTVQSTGLAAATGTCTVTQTGVSEIVLEAGETIHVGFLSKVVQVAGLLGATVAGIATWHIGTQGGVDPSVNPPAIDTITEMVGSATGLGTAAASAAQVKPTVASATGLGTAQGVLGSIASTVGAATGVGVAAGTLAAVKEFAGAAQGVGIADGKMAKVAGFTGTVDIGGGGSGGTTIIAPVFGVFD
ncbi:MAG TPA: hypothetical protein VFV57_05895 [Limnobacter sp.]|nr:hypothetical protein [Limnobacter sp.]